MLAKLICMKSSTWFVVIMVTATANFLAITPRALAEEKEKTPPTIKFEGMAVPIVEDGRLSQYVLVRFNVELSSSDTARTSYVFKQSPYIRDAIVRSAYKTNLRLAGQPNALDQDRFRALVRQSWSQFVNVKEIKRVVILEARPGPKL